jgi:hypothetical protein
VPYATLSEACQVLSVKGLCNSPALQEVIVGRFFVVPWSWSMTGAEASAQGSIPMEWPGFPPEKGRLHSLKRRKYMERQHQCRFCGRGLRSQARFCLNCGGRVTKVCLVCGTESRCVGARFCRSWRSEKLFHRDEISVARPAPRPMWWQRFPLFYRPL